MHKIFILLISMILLLNATDTNKDEKMTQIIISKHNASHSTPWGVRDMVEVLLKENVPVSKINADAYRSYWVTESMQGFRHAGYASFLFTIKNDETIKKLVFKTLKEMNAIKHLEYMIKQEKLFRALSKNDQKEFATAKYYGYMNKEVSSKIKGSGYKEIDKKENLEQLHTLWLKSLKSFKVASFDEKYEYLSKVVGRDIMPVAQREKDIYNFLLKWNEQKVFFDLMDFADIEVWGEIEKFYWKEWAPDAKDIDKITDEFYSIGVDGAGGNFLLWYYKDMKKEPAVIYFSSEGEKAYLASSLAEYVCTLPSTYGDRNLETYLKSLKNRPLQKEIKSELYDIFSDYEKKNKLDMTEEEMAPLLVKEIEKYKKLSCEKFKYKLHDTEEKKRFELLSKQLDGDPPSTLDYIKAYYDLAKKFGLFRE